MCLVSADIWTHRRGVGCLTNTGTASCVILSTSTLGERLNKVIALSFQQKNNTFLHIAYLMGKQGLLVGVALRYTPVGCEVCEVYEQTQDVLAHTSIKCNTFRREHYLFYNIAQQQP